MKSWVWGVVFLYWLAHGASFAIAQDTTQNNSTPSKTPVATMAVLDDAWLGKWKGTAKSLSPEQLNVTFDMEIEIKLLEDSKRYGWTTTFSGPQGNVVKAYELIPQAKANHFVIDEKNTILIDATLLGDTLSSHFTVHDQTIWCQYRIGEEQGEAYLEFDLYSASSSAVKTSGGRGSVPEVKSLVPSTRQTARLKKQK